LNRTRKNEGLEQTYIPQDLLNKIDGAFSAGKPRCSEGNLMHLTCVDDDSALTSNHGHLLLGDAGRLARLKPPGKQQQSCRSDTDLLRA